MSRLVESITALLAAATIAALVPRAADAAKHTPKIFTELAQQKGSLGRTVVLVDVILVDDIGGRVEKVKLGRSRALAQQAATTLRRSLAEKGLSVDSVLVASIGSSCDPLFPFQSDSLVAAGPDDTSALIRAPFYVDSLFGDPARQAVLREFTQSSWSYERKKGKPPGFLAEPVTLGPQLVCDTIGLLSVVSWGIPTTKKVLAALVNASYPSRSSFVFVLADTKNGQVLWKEGGFWAKSADEGLIDKVARDATKDIP